MSRRSETRVLADTDYQRLLAFRSELREFIRWSEHAARQAGLTPALHQLLLVVRGHPAADGPTVGDAAAELHIRHHSAVELAKRAEAAGLLERVEDAADRRVVRLRITPKGNAALRKLSALHLEEIDRLADDLRPLWWGLDDHRNEPGPKRDEPAAPRRPPGPAGPATA